MTINTFIERHLILAALLVSALWFNGGHQYLRKGKSVLAFSWQLIAVLVLTAFCVNAVLARGWLSLTVAIVTILFEVWLMKRHSDQKHPPVG
ncbi:MAG TPA: hypothetical protein VMT20_20075 [Terriglobia bacterium]|nr:hypothetical protein [Terriglobia bacterium]